MAGANAPQPYKTILVLNGPNLNLLGVREPEIYGTKTLESIHLELSELAESLPGIMVESYHSNHEGDLIERIHAGRVHSHGLIINAAGLSHTSVSLRDALAAYPHPIMEVHLTNIYKREPFRHHSYISEVADGVICGVGPDGYRLALLAIHKLMEARSA